MNNNLRFTLYALKKNIQGSAELRGSFITNIVGMGLNNLSLIVIWVFFVKSVGVIHGWTAIDIVLLQGFTALSYGFVLSFAAGVRRLPDYITTGSFDRFLTSPKNLLLRVSTAAFGTSAIGDIIFGVICLSIYGVLTNITPVQIFLLVVLIVITTIMFFSALLITYSISFLTVDGNSVASGLFEFFLTPALFHGGAFQGATRAFFTFIVPSLLISALPVEIVRDTLYDKLGLVFILTVVWLVLSIKVFYFGVKRYESSNFMTFGTQ